jgi:hypothetical protein
MIIVRSISSGGVPVLLLILLLTPFSGLKADTEKNWRFRVYLDNDEIGYHQVYLQYSGNSLKVTVNAYFKVKFLLFTAFRYRHRAYEVWQDNCLSLIDSDTDQNGEKYFIRPITSNRFLTIETQDGEQQLRGCVHSFAYWNPQLLKSDHLLNSQTGEYQPVTLLDRGQGHLRFKDREWNANHIQLNVDDKSIDLFYDEQQQWIGLQTVTDSGHLLSYIAEKIADTTQPYTALNSSGVMKF